MTMFKLTAGVFPNLFVLYVSRYIYLQIIYFKSFIHQLVEKVVLTTDRKATDSLAVSFNNRTPVRLVIQKLTVISRTHQDIVSIEVL